jgi:hypothetical protein
MTNSLRQIQSFNELLPYLEEELDWPLQEYGFEDLTFEYSPAELGLKDDEAVKIKSIHQLRPLQQGQPWGIFFVEFENKKLPVVVLRRILSHLVIKKRASANRAAAAAWATGDLLFISAFGHSAAHNREIAFAHFHQEGGELPTLRVLGWDGGDTLLKLEHVAATLRDKLSWPEDTGDEDGWRDTWATAFRHRQGHVIRTADALAAALAALARRIRDAALLLLAHEAENGQLRSLHKAFRTALIQDLSEADFADTYAQTITYGLLTAAISRTEMTEGAYGTALIADNVADIVPVTNPFLKEMLQTFLQAGGRKGGIDFDELGIQDVVELLRGEETDLPAVLRDFGNKTQGEDPVIHFYEHFLAAYDKQLKVQRGVFYTPKPVVSYIVRSVHELLQTEFGLADGLADTTTWGEMAQRNPDLQIPEGTDPDSPFVMILDPATGTATFLVEVVEKVYQTMQAKWQKAGLTRSQSKEAWNWYVPQHLLPRLYGYELMMAPYAIAHMKMGLKLHETGYHFGSSERVRIFLTNTLEKPDSRPSLTGILPALAHEADAVNYVKQQQSFTVAVGNPPYSHLSSNLTAEAMAMVEPYKFIEGERIQERGALSLQKNLQDDYIKFLRVGEQTIEKSGLGIIGFITNNSFFDSRSFRGMRYHFGKTFSRCWLLDLHGSGKKEETVDGDDVRDENVFDIVQGVGITLCVRKLLDEKFAQMQRADILGSRKRKYEFLNNQILSLMQWKKFELAPPFYLFDLQNISLLEEYQRFSSLHSVFPLYSSGVKTHRDKFAYSFTAKETEKKLIDFCDLKKSDQLIRTLYGLKDTNVWSLQKQRRKVELTDLIHSINPALYRPFDVRSTCFSDEIIELTRRTVMDQMNDGTNIAMLCSKQQAEEGFRHVFCTRLISDWGAVSNRTRESTSAFPLFLTQPVRNKLHQAGLDLGIDTQINVSPLWLEKLGSPETVFQVVYSILHAPSYRSRYSAFLRSDFPRVPLINNEDLVNSLVQFGKELIFLHLLEFALEDESDAPIDWPQYPRVTQFGGINSVIDKLPSANKAWKEGFVAINRSSGFTGVSEDVWNFYIGGYQVCHKWLKDRQGRTLTDADILHYCKIVTAIHQTIRIMAQIDEAIEEHGSWPIE